MKKSTLQDRMDSGAPDKIRYLKPGKPSMTKEEAKKLLSGKKNTKN